jgi:hypothetical protein
MGNVGGVYTGGQKERSGLGEMGSDLFLYSR